MKLSRLGLLFIARREAFVSVAYQDGAHMSIGFGHNNSKLKAGDKIDLPAGLSLLASDIAKREPTVARVLKTPVSQHQYDALFSLYYNVGTKALQDIAALWNKRWITKGINRFTEYVWVKQRDANGNLVLDEEGEPIRIMSPGLLKRRKMEQEIAKHADYGDLSRFPSWPGDPAKTPVKWITL